MQYALLIYSDEAKEPKPGTKGYGCALSLDRPGTA